jgi:predicted metal-dependent hydrolase
MFLTPKPQESDFHKISPHLTVRVSDRARRLTLRLDQKNRRVCLVIPKRASIRKAYEFAYQNKKWIESKINTLPHPIPFTHGTCIPLLGDEVEIMIDFNPAHRVTKCVLENGELHVTTNKADPSARITRFLKDLAAREFLVLARQKATPLGKGIANVTIRDMATRWGSCGPDGTMSLNWRLIFAPEMAIDYVISHEVAHLIHHNHGSRFWKLCADLSKDFSTGSQWMRDHGHTLMSYGIGHPTPLEE